MARGAAHGPELGSLRGAGPPDGSRAAGASHRQPPRRAAVGKALRSASVCQVGTCPPGRATRKPTAPVPLEAAVTENDVVPPSCEVHANESRGQHFGRCSSPVHPGVPARVVGDRQQQRAGLVHRHFGAERALRRAGLGTVHRPRWGDAQLRLYGRDRRRGWRGRPGQLTAQSWLAWSVSMNTSDFEPMSARSALRVPVTWTRST